MFVSVNDGPFDEINKIDFLEYYNEAYIYAFLTYYENHEDTKRWY